MAGSGFFSNLMYHTNSVYLKKGVSITIDTGEAKKGQNIVAFYIQNCGTGDKDKIPANSGSYIINTDGAYWIYGISSQGDIIDMSNKISTQESSRETEDGFIPL